MGGLEFVVDDGVGFVVVEGGSLVGVRGSLGEGVRCRVFVAPRLEWVLLHDAGGFRGDVGAGVLREHYRLPDGRVVRLLLGVPDDGVAEVFSGGGWVEVARVVGRGVVPRHQHWGHRVRMLDLELRGLVECVLFSCGVGASGGVGVGGSLALGVLGSVSGE
jgi:hypothetical protein